MSQITPFPSSATVEKKPETQNPPIDYLTQLPPELLMKIFEYLPTFRDAKALSLCCKKTQSVFLDPLLQKMWIRHFYRFSPLNPPADPSKQLKIIDRWHQGKARVREISKFHVTCQTAYSHYHLSLETQQLICVECHTIRFYNLQTGEQTAEILLNPEPAPEDVELFPPHPKSLLEGSLLFFVNIDGTIRIYNIETKQLFKIVNTAFGIVNPENPIAIFKLLDIAITPDQKKLVALLQIQDQYFVSIWDIENNICLHTKRWEQPLDQNFYVSMNMTPDGKKCLFSSLTWRVEPQSLYILDLDSLEFERFAQKIGKIVAISADSTRFASVTLSRGSPFVQFWDITTQTQIAPAIPMIDHYPTDPQERLEFSPNNQAIFFGVKGQKPFIYDFNKKTPPIAIGPRGPFPSTYAKITPNFERVLMATDEHFLEIWDVKRNISLRQLTHPSFPQAEGTRLTLKKFTISPDGMRLFCEYKNDFSESVSHFVYWHL